LAPHEISDFAGFPYLWVSLMDNLFHLICGYAMSFNDLFHNMMLSNIDIQYAFMALTTEVMYPMM
jgi:hypothetical protein